MAPPTILFDESWFGYTNVNGNIDVPENEVYFLFVSASDDTTDYYDLMFELLGDDAQWFELVDGSLSFNPEPDFESPSDADFDNTYELTIRVTDLDGDYTEDFADSWEAYMAAIDAGPEALEAFKEQYPARYEVLQGIYEP